MHSLDTYSMSVGRPEVPDADRWPLSTRAPGRCTRCPKMHMDLGYQWRLINPGDYFGKALAF